MNDWDPADLPSQAGKTVVVTGAGRGIGYFVAEQLASAGARVILTTRSEKDAAMAVASIRSRLPDASLETVLLDLASLDSVRAAAARLGDLGPIDVLINNAGNTGGTKKRSTTADGLELMIGTNAFGPYALTALLWPALAPDAVVVSLGSLATRLARAKLDDYQQSTGRFSSSKAYAYSKHGTHAFAFELDRRLRARGSGIRSLLAHPGFALDGNSARRPGINDRDSAGRRFVERLMRPVAHGKDRGAWAVVRAAVDPYASGGDFFGPKNTLTGHPVVVPAVPQSRTPEFGAAFWRQAAAATGIAFDP